MKILIYRNTVSGDDIDIVTLFCTCNKGKSVVSSAKSHSHNFHKLEDRKIWFPSKLNCDGKPPGYFSLFHVHLSNSVSVFTSFPIVVILTLSSQSLYRARRFVFETSKSDWNRIQWYHNDFRETSGVRKFYIRLWHKEEGLHNFVHWDMWVSCFCSLIHWAPDQDDN